RTVTAGDRPLNLTGTEYLILELLMRRSPAVVDRKAIAEHAWADETDPLGSNAIDVQMSRLRAKLPSAGIRIVTVRGAGYRLLELPVAYRRVTGPTTTSLAGTNVRLEGRAISSSYVVVGQNMAPVEATQSTIVLAELLIGPILLIAVFLGAVAIGRRVATPIEVARRRQLDFSADASHELRTPLSVIEAHTSLALAQERDRTWYRNAFERVSDESRRMRRMLDDLLWLSRFDASQGRPNTEPVDMGVLASQAVDRFRAIAEARNQRLDVEAT